MTHSTLVVALLFHLYACCGVGLAIAKDIDLSVTEDFLRVGGVIDRYISSGGCKLRLKGEVFGSSQQVRVIMWCANIC